MSTTQATVTEAQSYPMTELGPHASKDAEASPVEETPADADVVQSEAATPMLKLVVAGYSFFCAGVNDGTLGPLIPYIISSFGIGTGEIAIMYATLPFLRAGDYEPIPLGD